MNKQFNKIKERFKNISRKEMATLGCAFLLLSTIGLNIKSTNAKEMDTATVSPRKISVKNLKSEEVNNPKINDSDKFDVSFYNYYSRFENDFELRDQIIHLNNEGAKAGLCVAVDASPSTKLGLLELSCYNGEPPEYNLSKEQLKSLPTWLETLDEIHDDVVKNMKSSNFPRLSVGLETGILADYGFIYQSLTGITLSLTKDSHDIINEFFKSNVSAYYRVMSGDDYYVVANNKLRKASDNEKALLSELESDINGLEIFWLDHLEEGYIAFYERKDRGNVPDKFEIRFDSAKSLTTDKKYCYSDIVGLKSNSRTDQREEDKADETKLKQD